MKYFFLILICPLLFSCSQKEKVKISNSYQSPGNPPKECIQWFDGCNTCRVDSGQILGCTKMVCFVMEAPKCLKYKTGLSKFEIRKKECKKINGIWQRKKNGAWICMNKTTDANIACNTSKECQGICLYYKGKPRGFCSRHTPFVGCAQEYQNGQHFEVCE